MGIKFRVIGGAGTGKTTYLVSRIREGLESSVKSDRIGLISFTNAAAAEVVKRLRESEFTYEDDDWGGPVHMDFPWVRTIHSCVFQLLSLKRGDLLVGDDVAQDLIDDGVLEVEERSLFELSIAVWGMRGTLKGRKYLEKAAAVADDRLVDGRLWRYVGVYEQWKRLEGKIDFVDMLAIYAGIKFNVDGDFEVVEPDGGVPQIDLWLFDEQQDVSPLLSVVCDRLASNGCVIAYYAGDPFQSIYGWAGAGPQSFMGVEVDEQVVLRKSYRVPSNILSLGEFILRRCTDYWDRGIEPYRDGGQVEYWDTFNIGEIASGGDVFVLARTNARVEELARELDWYCVPWIPVGSGRGWFQVSGKVLNSQWKMGSKKSRAVYSLWKLSSGRPISGSELRNVVEHIPSVNEGQRYLQHGAKVWFDKFSDAELDDMAPCISLGDLQSWYVCDAFIRMLSNRGWLDIVDGAKRWVNAVEKYGEDVVLNPRIKLGTIHVSKGREADWVVLDLSVSKKMNDQIDRAFREGASDLLDEEWRVWYVGVTRARSRVTLMHKKGWHMIPLFKSDNSFMCW